MGRKIAPSMGWIGVPAARNFSSSTARSTPESITAMATPSPVARGSWRMRSGVNRAKISSKTVGSAMREAMEW